MGKKVYQAISYHKSSDFTPETAYKLNGIVGLIENIFRQPDKLETFSTFRNSTEFDPDHWMQEMNSTTLHLIQNLKSCQTLMKLMNYTHQ
jgi:hypothetical protein